MSYPVSFSLQTFEPGLTTQTEMMARTKATATPIGAITLIIEMLRVYLDCINESTRTIETQADCPDALLAEHRANLYGSVGHDPSVRLVEGPIIDYVPNVGVRAVSLER